ncbi:glycosyl transferase family protein [Chondrocystis sp. NIES-4102]|nr:glycosyl transferase family protein [Chondrocystis sp. NIES-4102]
MTAELVRAIAVESNWSKVYHLADTYRQQQQWQAAAIAYQRSIELQPDFFWSWHNLADVLLKLQHWQQAVLAYRRAVDIDPDFFWSWHNLADALLKLQHWQQAVLAYRRAVDIDPDFFWSWHNLADALLKLQAWDQAIAVLLAAIQLKPDHQPVYQKLGLAFKQRGDLVVSIQDYRRLIQSPPANSIFATLVTKLEFLLKIADTLANEHQTVGAIIFYYLVLEIDPSRLDVLPKLTHLLQKHQQLQKTITEGEEILVSQQSSLLIAQLTTSGNLDQVSTQQAVDLDSIKIKHHLNCQILPSQLEDLCNAVGWQRRPLEQVEQALGNSFAYVSAWYIQPDQEKLVGFARAVSDGIFQAILLDIVVDPNFQGCGLGTTLVNNLLQQLKLAGIRDIALFASPHLVDFYHRLGFVAQPHNLQWMLWSASC